MEVNNAADISELFNMLGAKYIFPGKEMVIQSAEDWLLDKQRSYRQDEYLSQLEKNAIYLPECVDGYCQVLTRILVEGKPEYRSDAFLIQYLAGARNYFGKKHTDKYLAFLRTGAFPEEIKPTGGSLYDQLIEMTANDNGGYGLDIKSYDGELDPNRYAGYRKVKATGDYLRYVDELEFNCKFYQGGLAVGDYFIQVCSKLPLAKSAARRMRPMDVLNAVRERMRLWTGICLGLVKI